MAFVADLRFSQIYFNGRSTVKKDEIMMESGKLVVAFLHKPDSLQSDPI